MKVYENIIKIHHDKTKKYFEIYVTNEKIKT